MNNNRRQVLKWVSLSSLGSLIAWNTNAQEVINNECLTTDDILGPFYVPGAPFITQLAPEGAAGTPLLITGTVYANDCETVIPQAIVDVWHANDDGDYVDEHYRGKVQTQGNGNYSFQTILPGKYLNGAQFRPRHFHYIVSFENTAITTQIYFQGDTSIPGDPWASSPDAEDRIIPLVEDENGVLHGVADIYLDVDPMIINQSTQIEKDRSGINKVFPNPLIENGQVEIHLAKFGSVQLNVFDLRGKNVIPNLLNQQLPSGKHLIDIHTNSNLGIKLPAGIYVLQMKLGLRIVDTIRFVIA